MRLSAMGDVAMTVPVLRTFVATYPEVKITVVSRPFFAPMFVGIPNVSYLIFDDKRRHKGFRGLIRLFMDLKALRVDAFADLHNVLRSKIVKAFFVINGKQTAAVDKARAEKRALLRQKNKIFKPLPGIFERHAKVFSALGFPIDLSQPVFPQREKLDDDLFRITGEKNTTWIGIAPFAQYPSKVYPADLMQTVIDSLTQNPAYKIFLFGGGKKEIAALNLVAKDRENVINVAGKTYLSQELQLIGNLDVMLSMDSGNAHIAAMMGVKTITLWGATHPYMGFAPFNQPFENALVSDRNQFPKIPTSVYGNKKVEGYEDAMRTISPELVVEKIKKALVQ